MDAQKIGLEWQPDETKMTHWLFFIYKWFPKLSLQILQVDGILRACLHGGGGPQEGEVTRPSI